MAGFSGGNRAKSNGPGFSCSKTPCYGSVPVPTLTRNRSSGLEPLPTLAITSVIAYYMDRNWASPELQLAFDEVDYLFCSAFKS